MKELSQLDGVPPDGVGYEAEKEALLLAELAAVVQVSICSIVPILLILWRISTPTLLSSCQWPFGVFHPHSLSLQSTPVVCKPLASFSPSFKKLVQAREALETKREEEQGRLEVRIQMLNFQLVIKHKNQEEEKQRSGERVFRAGEKRGCKTQ